KSGQALDSYFVSLQIVLSRQLKRRPNNRAPAGKRKAALLIEAGEKPSTLNHQCRTQLQLQTLWHSGQIRYTGPLSSCSLLSSEWMQLINDSKK
ncbi:hypothetical protein, partial [Shewanella algae]|uniref:hypothetical protein n=1 Tax=Shewanella algae TaxID=38313 RepID=UPI001C3F5B60